MADTRKKSSRTARKGAPKGEARKRTSRKPAGAAAAVAQEEMSVETGMSAARKSARQGGGKRPTAGKPAGAGAEAKAEVATALAQAEANVDRGVSSARKGGGKKLTARKPAGAGAAAKSKVATAVAQAEVNVETGKSRENGMDQVHSKAQRSETLVEVCLSVPQFRSRVISHLLRRLR